MPQKTEKTKTANQPEGTENIYCLKCKQKRDVPNVETTTLENGRSAYTGKCPVCGSKVFKFKAKQAAAN